MSDKNEKYQRRRLSSSYFSTIISIALVLFLLGLMGFLLINARRISNNVKENIGFEVILKDSVPEAEIRQFQKTMDANEFVRATRFISREEAAGDLQQKIGDDFIKFLGYNPLSSAVEVKLKAAYARPDSIGWIEKEMTQSPIVKEVFYEKSLVNLVNENVNKISFVLLGFTALLLTISIALINNTIRLSIYSKRFLIKTMQLVGATSGFIRKPFLLKSLRHGAYSGVFAIILLGLTLYGLFKQLPELFVLEDIKLFGILAVSLVVLGILISFISTFVAIGKFLKLKLDDLHY
ncbi:MAG: cell division protein FtsX [Bacteroidia bacterium]|nr:cell division protein FtsX [Bacteroidia bacterium]